MIKGTNTVRDFMASHPWWCALIVAAMVLIPKTGIWLAAGFWLAIIGNRIGYRNVLPAAKVAVRVDSLGPSVNYSVGDRVTRYDVFGMCYYAVPHSVIGSTVLCVEREPQNSNDKNALKVSVNGHHIGYLSVWAAAEIAPEWDALGVASMDVHGRVMSTLDAYVEVPTNDALRTALSRQGDSPRPMLLRGHRRALPSAMLRTQVPVQPWGSCTRSCALSVVKKSKAGIMRVCMSRGHDGKREKVRLEDLDAHIRLTANHKLAVFIDDVQVGMVPDKVREPYLNVIEALHASDRCLSVPASIWMNRQHGFRAGASIKLPRPDEIATLAGMPHGRVAILPRGRKVQVTGEEDHIETLLGLLDGQHSVPVVAELGSYIKQLKTTQKTVVGVKVCGETVGMLSTQMSQHFLPVVEACEDAGIALVCRGRITGNQLKVDLVLEAIKGSELPPEWVDDNVSGHAIGPVSETAVSVSSPYHGE
ncbi:DNA-binding protein [Cutibacterium sp. WCA-380-WT-3A]|uniref:DNA-binding protein n=1 Tax=Cutibacterium porci TaxID=2605781 RepID=A0A7K0J9N4_9ACTN|nr:HIRAN domain-containing protein [Cutibacterium porci]MSS46580.1 DNA-binding protein [Cutibacterium porci]